VKGFNDELSTHCSQYPVNMAQDLSAHAAWDGPQETCMGYKDQEQNMMCDCVRHFHGGSTE
jgi:hypothetical protein